MTAFEKFKVQGSKFKVFDVGGAPRTMIKQSAIHGKAKGPGKTQLKLYFLNQPRSPASGAF